MNKSAVMGMLLVLMLVLVVAGCSGTQEENDVSFFTAEEVAEFDGQDGRAAYIVVDGTVYEVTDVAQWAGGAHQGMAAGQDVTEAFKNISPHDDSILNRARIAGTVTD